MKIFQQPNAGRAMDCGNGKGDMALRPVAEIEQFSDHLGVLQIIKPVILPGLLCCSRIGGEFIITAQVIFLKQLKNKYASGAAEIFIVKMKPILPTVLPTVVASGFFFLS